MRRVSSSVLALGVLWVGWACTSSTTTQTYGEEGNLDGSGGSIVAANTSSTNASTGTPAATSTAATSTNGTSGGTTSMGATSGTSSTTGAATTGVGGATNAAGSTTGAGGSSGSCTDEPPDDRETCATWAEWGECGAEWLADFCDQSCGRCSGNATSGGGNGGATNGNTVNNTVNNATSNTSTTGSLGDDNPWGDVQGGQQGWASRYWDCCKPSCGWQGNASNPVHSCDVNDNELGVSDETNGCELNGESGAFTCHSMAPWAYSTQVSFGYAAINGVSCGSCFQIQFTGTASRGGGPGAAAIAGKSMIIMATNIGGIQQGQFDLLIPGGGVGDFNGCSGQWGVDNSELGEQYGGFLSDCGGNDHNQIKSCVRERCESVFQSRGLTELYNGCIWFVDWFEAADNPDFVYESVECPQELVAGAH